jgi:hypothetical protein
MHCPRCCLRLARHPVAPAHCPCSSLNPVLTICSAVASTYRVPVEGALAHRGGGRLRPQLGRWAHWFRAACSALGTALPAICYCCLAAGCSACIDIRLSVLAADRVHHGGAITKGCEVAWLVCDRGAALALGRHPHPLALGCAFVIVGALVHAAHRGVYQGAGAGCSSRHTPETSRSQPEVGVQPECAALYWHRPGGIPTHTSFVLFLPLQPSLHAHSDAGSQAAVQKLLHPVRLHVPLHPPFLYCLGLGVAAGNTNGLARPSLPLLLLLLPLLLRGRLQAPGRAPLRPKHSAMQLFGYSTPCQHTGFRIFGQTHWSLLLLLLPLLLPLSAGAGAAA